MGKLSKILVVILLIMAVGCFGMYFFFSLNKTFIVKFDTDGGNTIENQEVKENELVVKPSNPTKENSVFLNWTLDGKIYDFQTAVTDDLTLKAKWQVMYNVTAKLEENEYSQQVLENEKVDISKFNFPEREGYVIKIYQDDMTEYNLDNNVTSNLTLTANYVALNKYKVKFTTNTSKKLNDVEVWEGSLIEEPNITRDGYNLLGWYLDDALYDFSTPVTSDLTLKAKWAEKGKLTVTFNVDDKVYKTQSVKENKKVSKPTNPTKKDNVFVEWQLNGKTYNFNDPVTSDITLEAVFREAQTFTVKFDSNGGSNVGEKIVVEGTKLVKPTNPTKKGYVFVEWQLNGKTYNFNNVIKEDMTLKAVWEDDLPEFIVSFNSNGGSDIRAQHVKQNKLATKPKDDPIRTGYKFIKWTFENNEYDFNTPVTKNITLIAEWKELELFTISFDTDGGRSIASQNIREGEKAIMVVPKKDGCEFVEWQLNGTTYDFNTPITSSITLKAVWK